MYGMINAYLKELIITDYGKDIWNSIARKNKLENEVFIEMLVYDDNLTFKIVQTTVETCNITVEAFLRKAGRGWVLHTSQGSYSTFYKMYTSMEGFLSALNTIHEELSIVMEGLKPPRFTVSGAEKGFYLDYASHREGLIPFVYGLLQGLAQLYEEDVTINESGRVKETGAYRFVIKKRPDI